MSKIEEEIVSLSTEDVLLQQWHPTLNAGLTLRTARAKDKVWWLDLFGHAWQAAVNSRRKGSRCPYCTNRMLLTGFNDFATVHPLLAEQWHPTKNDFKPSEVFPRSARMIWWMDSLGHEWQATPANRTAQKPTGCPYCSRNKLLVGFNDLLTLYPEVAAEWHPTKNDTTPDQVSAANGSKLRWWLCKLEHEYQAKPANRTAKTPTGCPYCSGNKLLRGFNDLVTTHPEIAAEWHTAKNGSRRPSAYTRGSTYKAWWICKQNHEWATEIYHRTGHQEESRGCPKCSKSVSKEEQAIFALLSNRLNSLQDSQTLSVPHNKTKWARVDMLWPAAKIVIEYDGSYWHRDKEEFDSNKSSALIAAGYKVLRLREQPLPSLRIESDLYAELFFPIKKDFNMVAEQVLEMLKDWKVDA